MKILKRIGIVLGALLLLFLILGIFMPKDLVVEKSKTINAPANYLYNIVNDFKTNPDWNPWVQEDPDMKLSYGTKTQGTGATYSWSSEKMGNGKVAYTSTEQDKAINALLEFEGMSPSTYGLTFTPEGNNRTKVIWTMNTRMGFPYNVFGPFFKYTIKKSYKKGLDNLEVLAKVRMNEGKYDGYTIKETMLEERKYIMSRSEVAVADIQKFYTQNLGAIFKKVQDEGLTMNGMPCGLFYKYDALEGQADMAAAIPVSTTKDIQGLNSVTLPKQQALQVEYYGDYANLQNAHRAMASYMRDRNLLSNPPMIEEYVTDPIKEKDPAKWLTNITYYYTKSGM